jgi:hypothetical protein
VLVFSNSQPFSKPFLCFLAVQWSLDNWYCRTI